MHIIGLMLVSLALASQSTAPAKVETTFDKKADFGALHTYSWTAGSGAFNAEANKLIIAAIDAEMTKLGFTKATTGADVTIAYHTVSSTDVDLKALDKLERESRSVAPAPTRTRGRLVVIMRSASSSQQLWTASTREYVDPDIAKFGDMIQGVAARLFETYPGRKAARSK
jgi:hypothetical protein